MKRRALLSAAAALLSPLAARTASAKELVSSELSLSEFTVEGDRAFGKALLAVPRSLAAEPALLVLLHGLGETFDQGVGARAYAERYGLLSAVARLQRPPLAQTEGVPDYFGPGRLLELNARLAARAYQPPVLLCCYTPNPYKAGGDATIARFARFTSGALKAEVERRVARAFSAPRCVIGGVSLGGYLALEVFQRKPEYFCGVVSAQGAFGPGQAVRYAAGIETAINRVGARSVELITSSFDPYRRNNELFFQQLQRRKVPARLRVAPGPHDQRWLQESGVIEMLLAADDVLAKGQGAIAKATAEAD